MTLILSGTNGLSDVDGDASTPAVRGTDANTGIFFPAADTIAFAEGGAEAMRIDSSGNLNIGTNSSFGGKISILKTPGTAFSDSSIAVTDGSNVTLYIGNTSTTASSIWTSDLLSFGTGADAFTERMRITSGGGITTPGSATDPFEFGVNRNDGLSFVVTNANTSSPFGAAIRFPGATPNNTTNYFLFCDDSTNSKAIIYSDGSFQSRANSYGGISDVKLKQDIVDANSQWDDIKGLRIRKYRFKDEVAADPNYPSHLGVIAQEAELVSPGLVFESPDFEDVEVPVLDDEGNPVLDEEGNPQVTTERQATGTVTKGVKYSILYMKAVKALQEAIERIETLEAKVAALEAQ
jgi:hypothetical protein